MSLSPKVRRGLLFGGPPLLVAAGVIAVAYTRKPDVSMPPVVMAPATASTAKHRLGFSLRDADPERPAARKSITGTALSQTETDELLARLPKLADSAAGAVPFARREESLKPPRPGTSVAAAFPPPPSNAPRADIAVKELQVLRASPDGDVETAPNVSVTFNEPMVPVTSHAELEARTPPIKIDPQPKGTFQWLGTQTLVFKSEVELPRSTEYKIEIPAGTKAISGHVLEKAYSFSFRTPTPVLKAHLPSGEGNPLQPMLFAEFDQRINPDLLLGKVLVTNSGNLIPVALATPAQIAKEEGLAELIAAADKHGKGRTLAFRPINPLPTNSDIHVSFPSGTPSAEGPRVTEKEQTFDFKTHGLLEMRSSECDSPCNAHAGFSLHFSNPLDASLFDKKFVTTLPPIEDLHVYNGGNAIRIGGKLKANVTYMVSVNRALKDVYGQALTGNIESSFTVIPFEPRLFSETQMMSIHEPNAKPTYSLFSTNDKTVSMKMYRVDPAYYQKYRLDRQTEPYGGDDFVPQGTLVKSELLKLDAKLDEVTETVIDLAPALREGSGHVLIIAETTRTFKNKWERQRVREWVQVTQLGVSALDPARGDLNVYASKLSDGSPLAGVAVGFLNAGSVQTGADGRAKLAGLPYQAGAGLLIARQGADSTFVDGLGQRSPREPAYLRMFTFDDRGLYKPKETVSVKAIIRRVGQTRGGDITVPAELSGATIRYIAVDSRGAEIAKGSTKLDESGGLFVQFKLPDNANLGSGHIEFDGPNDTSFGHGFRIDEFRRPEFEVSASVTTPTHQFGGFAIVETKASYFSGGGLQAAETKYTVNRSEGRFTPPNRSRFQFGRNSYHYWYESNGSVQNLGPTSAQWSGRTDAQGAHRMRIDLEGTEEAYPMSLSVNAQVIDQNLQQWTTSTNLLVHPSAAYVGLRPAKPFVRAGEPIVMGAVVADVEGKVVAGRSVHLASYRSVSEQEKGKWVSKKVDEASCDWVSTAEETERACSLTTNKAGLYTVEAEVTDAAGKKSKTLMTVWVTGAADPRDKTLKAGTIELTADKTEYKVGDKAEILIHAPFAPAQGLLMVSEGGVLREERITLNTAAESITIDLDKSSVPSVEVQLVLDGRTPRLNAEGEVDSKLEPLPAFASGSIRLSVPPKDHELVVKAIPRATKLAPGGSTTIDLSLNDSTGAAHAGELAVIVVDESVLALSSHAIGSPLGEFFTSVGGGAGMHDSRRDLRRARDAALGGRLGRNRRGDSDDEQGGKSESDSFGGAGLGMMGRGAPGGGQGYGNGHGRLAALPESAMDLAPPSPISAAAPMASVAIARAPAGVETKISGDRESSKAKDANKAEDSIGKKVANATPIAMRSNFDALALFAARVKTDSEGKASVEVKLPESTTRYRVMAVAWDKGSYFGNGESQITAQLPLTVRPSPPRFLNYGDKFELPIIVQNQSDAPRHVSLALRTVNANLQDPLGRGFDVAANDRVEVHIPASAKMPGEARFQIAISSDGFSDAADVKLPVWTPGTTEAFATYGVVDAGATAQKVEVPKGIDLNWGSLDFSTSSTALFALSDAILYLDSYPYDCNEQIASRILGIASLKDMIAAFNSSALPNAALMQGRVLADLARLKQRQDRSSGGWGFWVKEPWPYLTLHVAFALSVAKAKGYPVDHSMLLQATLYLQQIDSHIDADYGEEAKRSLQAYAAFVLKRLGSPDPARAASIIAEAGGVEKTPIDALAWLLPTLAAEASYAELTASIHKHLSNRAVETAGAAHFVTSYGKSDYLILHSEHRTDALVLNALIETNPKSDLLPKVVTGLLGSRKKGHWENTQEDAFVLVALDAYFQKFEKISPDFVARAWLGDASLQATPFKGFNTKLVETSIPMAEFAKLGGGDLVIQKDGAAGRLYYRLGLRYAPTDLQLPPLERGFVVNRRYEFVDSKEDVKRDEAGVWHIKAGASVRVRVQMVAQAERHHVALVDPMPAGFEAVNAELKGAAAVAPNSGSSAGGSRYGGGYGRFNWRYYGYWGRWYEHSNLRDERAEAFTSYLPGGVHEFVYTARATTLGNYVVPQAKAEEMYAPEVFGRSAGDRVIVE